MSSAREISKQHLRPTSPSSTNQYGFDFPSAHHLLITTASSVCAWDWKGVHSVFKSSKSGVVAAREAKDGSGVLAVADKRVVVLHDTKRGQEKSWGLEADGDEVRHLEYTADAKALFLATSLTPDIQRYSTERSRLLSPTRAHGSPPIALAISSTGHLMVSASDNPPVVYLQHLTHNSVPLLLEARASETAVSFIIFHPERPNIFLLAFRDGNVAAYDATRIGRNADDSFAKQESLNGGELCRLHKLHRPTVEGSNMSSITGAAFLPGYKTRAVSVGSDGRCRLIDFADGGVIMRTWHAKAPVTSVSIVSLKPTVPEARMRSTGNRNSHLIGGPTSTNNLIAIGRRDGKVHLYDSVGLLLAQEDVSERGEKIISVEWARGPSPCKVMAHDRHTELPVISPNKAARKSGSKPLTQLSPHYRGNRGIDLSTEDSVANTNEFQSSAKPTRKFTMHPDEVNEMNRGTVQYTPSPQKPAAASTNKQDNYLDLFSPVKQQSTKLETKPVERVGSPPRSRPRISSQTFIKSPEPVPATQHGLVARQRNLALFPTTETGSETPHAEAPSDTAQERRRDSAMVDPLELSAPKPRITFKTTPRRGSRRSGGITKSHTAPNSNAKVLADLRKMSTYHATNRPGGMLSAYSAKPSPLTQQQPSPTPDPETSASPQPLKHDQDDNLLHVRRRKAHIETEASSIKALKAHEKAHMQRHWLDDSVQDTSLDGDIWLTSDSNGNTRTSKRSRRRNQRSQAPSSAHKQQHDAPARPPARQTSRSRVGADNGTLSTNATVIRPSPAKPKLAPETKPKHPTDGSAEADTFSVANYMPPGADFEPSSADVRELFPRGSSLSPAKKKGKGTPGRVQRIEGKGKGGALREVAVNAAAGKTGKEKGRGGVGKSPFARARAGKDGKGEEGETLVGELAEDGAGVEECEQCDKNISKVRGLESEVTRLKGEVLALKAMLRRGGVGMAMPAAVSARKGR